MAFAELAKSGPHVSAGLAARNPVLLASAVAWVWMVVDAARPVPSLCLSGENLALIARGFGASLATGRLFDEALLWAAMVTAMMLPLQVAPLRHVVLRSFRRRRARAVAAFRIGYGAVWVAAGLATIPLLAALSTSGVRAMPLVGASQMSLAASGP